MTSKFESETPCQLLKKLKQERESKNSRLYFRKMTKFVACNKLIILQFLEQLVAWNQAIHCCNE
jgi:hypothetical protein